MASVEKVWSAYKANPASEALYTDDAFVVYLPTSAGGRGLGDVVRFYSHQDFDSSANIVKETIHKKIVGEDAIIEEVEWSVTFTSGECAWLLPNLDKSHLIDATVIFPAVISANFSASKISSIRVYWDQASLLKQLKIIGERQRWPIRGIEQIDALRKPHMLQLNPFGRGSEAASGRLLPSSSFGVSKNGEPKKHPMSSSIFANAGPEPQRLSSRVNQPGGTGGKSRVFDEDAPLPGQRRTTGKGILPGFDPDVPEPAPLAVRSPPRRTTGKSILPGFDDDEPEPQRLSSRVNQPGGTGGKSHIFDDTPPTSPPHRPSAKSILPGADPDELISTSPPIGRPFAGKSNQSTLFDEQPIGMASSISGSTRRPNADANVNTNAANTKANTNANATLSPSISSTTTASDSSSRTRRQNASKNDSHFSFSDEETGPTESLSASGRKYSSRANTSSFSFADTEETTSFSASTKGRSKAVFNESQLDKDPSKDGDYRQYVTPSSRVLRAPGGGSSITFG